MEQSEPCLPQGVVEAQARVPVLVEFGDRLKEKMQPASIEECNSVLEFIQRGGRLQAIDYTKVPEEEKEEGFRRAREYLNQPMKSIVNGYEFYDAGNPRIYHHPNPNDSKETFGDVYPLPISSVDYVMHVAMDETWSPEWDGEENFEVRKWVLDRYMESVYKDRHVYAALMALCQGKTGNEVLRDMQEHFDFWRAYREVGEVMAFNEFQLESKGDTTLEYRPYDGVVGIWQPFNFSCIGIGDATCALFMGNSVVIHTSARNVGTYKWLYEKLLRVGVPPNRIQFVVPHDDPDPSKVDTLMSEALAADPAMQVIFFTGSHAVAQKLHAIQARKVQEGVGRLDYKLVAEASGYNPFVITGIPGGIKNEEAIGNLLNAVTDAATGLQSHKCSSVKEFVVSVDPKGVEGLTPADAKTLKERIAQHLANVGVGPVEHGGVDMGSLIDDKMRNLVAAQVQTIIAEGGRVLTADPVVFYEVPNGGSLDTMEKVEVFAPVVRWNEVNGLDKVVERVNNLDYALTGTVVASDEETAKLIRAHMRQGVVYVSSDDGKIDGCTAAPAPKIPFGGSGKSGTVNSYRSGDSRHPLAFAVEVSRPRCNRGDWGKGKYPPATADVLNAVARRDPNGVIRWVRDNLRMSVRF